MKTIIKIFLPLIAVLVLISCGKTDTIPTDTEESPPYFQTNDETFDIETPYCTLKYPAKWKDVVNVEKAETDDGYEVKFTAIIDSVSIPLYSVVFGDLSDGYSLGVLKNGKEDINVGIIDHTSADKPTINEEKLDTYYEMCEDVNVIISKLVYDNGLILNN